MNEGKNQSTETILVDPATYAELNLYRAQDSRKRKKRLNWDQFFQQVIKGRERHDRLTAWAYTFGIFFLVTLILTFPLYLALSTKALLLFPMMVIVGFFVALFTAYILTPFSLRHFRPYKEDPQIQQYLEDLAAKAQVRTPKLLVAETPEINALAFTSLFGGRVCLTRGILDAYHQGGLSDEELKAIMGHEIGHIKHGDCFKWSFILSWLSLFDLIGTILLVLGGAFIATGAIKSVLSDRDNSGPLIALMGTLMVIAGVIQRLIGKVASIPAFHLSRRNEFAADLTGAQLTSADAHISALQKIELYNNQLIAKQLAQLPLSDRWQTAPRNISWIDGLFSTHPSIEKRVRAIEQIYEYQASPQGLLPDEAIISESDIPTIRTYQPLPGTQPVNNASQPVSEESDIQKDESDLFETPVFKEDAEPVEVPPTHKNKRFGRDNVISAVIVVGILLAGIFFIIPSLVNSTPNPMTDSVIPKAVPTPTTITQKQTQNTPYPTTLPTTKVTTVITTMVTPRVTTVATPLPLGQSAIVTLPFYETLQLKYNTVYRSFTSTKTLTLVYDVIPNQVTELKEIPSNSGYYSKTVTYNDPNAFLVITIRDAQTGDIVALNGFAKTYSSALQQKMVIRQTGNLKMEITGAKVSVDIAVT